jgi:hypothetical protein
MRYIPRKLAALSLITTLTLAAGTPALAAAQTINAGTVITSSARVATSAV